MTLMWIEKQSRVESAGIRLRAKVFLEGPLQ